MNFLKRFYSYFTFGRQFFQGKYFLSAQESSLVEERKKPKRTDIINYLIEYLNRDICYLEIGVRDPNSNFSKILAKEKYSVDPGYEQDVNKADFPYTSDDFFLKLQNGELLSPKIEFDVIFIDGLHLAEQVDRDIQNSLKHLKSDGFLVLHDCNPPSEWHARETYSHMLSPALFKWNGTTWKAFLQWRHRKELNSCCVDTDWGVGIFSKTHPIGKSLSENSNPFFEFDSLDKNRKEWLNLVSFDQLKTSLKIEKGY
jgi:hypothetical protein